MSGQTDPRDKGGVNANVTVSSGPKPAGNSHVMGAETGTAMVTQAVSFSVAVNEPQPFSVNLTTPDSDRIKLISVKIQVSDDGKSVSDAEVLATDCDLAAGQTTEFPLTAEQLDKLLPRLQVGSNVEVDVAFAAPQGVGLKIGIVGHGHSNRFEEVLEHLTHSATL